MLLLLAVIAGLAAGLGRSWFGKRHLQAPILRLVRLVTLAFLLRLLVFYLPATRQWASDDMAAILLVVSLLVLLVFAWVNRRQSGFWALGIGLGLNLLVIALNGGLMPIRPEAVEQQFPGAMGVTWQVGDRVGWNIILPLADTHLWQLSDYFLLPAWFPSRVAFSLGDGLIALGAFLALWAMGQGTERREERGRIWTASKMGMSLPGQAENCAD